MRNNLKKIIAVLLMILLLTSCASGGGDSTSSQLPDSSVPASSDPISSIPVSSDIPVSSTPASSDPSVPPEKPVLSLTNKSAWNYYTVCDLAYIDTNNVVHISPDFKAYASAAQKYDGKSGAVSVVSLCGAYTQELWILWKDQTVTYIHPTIKEVAKVHPARGSDDNLKEDPTDYSEDQSQGFMIHPSKLETHWEAVEKALKNKKAKWIFANPIEFYDGNIYCGFVDTKSAVRYYDVENVFTASTSDPFVYADGSTMVTKSGKAYGLSYVESENSLKCEVLAELGVVQALSTQSGLFVCLMKDGTLTFSGTEYGLNEAINQDKVVKRLFTRQFKMEAADGSLISWCGYQQPGMKPESAERVDQLMEEVTVYTDGTVKCEEDHWMHGVTNVKVLNK